MPIRSRPGMVSLKRLSDIRSHDYDYIHIGYLIPILQHACRAAVDLLTQPCSKLNRSFLQLLLSARLCNGRLMELLFLSVYCLFPFRLFLSVFVTRP